MTHTTEYCSGKGAVYSRATVLFLVFAAPPPAHSVRHDVSLTIDLPGDFYLFLDLTDMCGRPVLVSLVPGKQVK